MAETAQIESLDEWESLCSSSSSTPVFLLKHSTTCPISAAAHEQFMTAARQHETDDDVRFAIVKVIEARPVSNKIAEQLEIHHASPQLIAIKDGKAIWAESHYAITSKAIDAVLDERLRRQ